MQYIQKYDIRFLYHMTDLINLNSILKHGILSHNEAHKRGLVGADISNQGVQDRRSTKLINRIPLHDYVNFYFQPKNPMLSVKRDVQRSIVFLGAEPTLLLKPSTVFSDGNAGANPGKTHFWTGTYELDRLPWDIIDAPYWNDVEDGKRIKCAEILVYPKVEVESILKIFCHPFAQQVTQQEVFAGGLSIPVESAPQIYF